jgi:hypothetical protein
VESFKAWKIKFDLELAVKKAREDDEKLKAMTPKEKEEWKRAGVRLTGTIFDCSSPTSRCQHIYFS